MTSPRWAVLACLLVGALPALAEALPAQRLHSRYAELQDRLRDNPFRRPVVLDSTETQREVSGDVYAVLAYPFAAVSLALNNPDHWCDVISLHANTKYCRASVTGAGTVLQVHIGKKTPQELNVVPRIDFQYVLKAASPDYLDIELQASEGPLGTRDYRLAFEAVPLPQSRTFLHLTYSYATSFTAKLAMQAYLATVGHSKVGFTPLPMTTPGEAQMIGGVRGLVERNTMRYYLAIDSFLATAGVAPKAQLEKRLQTWFTAVETYPNQLHEMERGEYLAMKRAEYARQQLAD